MISTFYFCKTCSVGYGTENRIINNGKIKNQDYINLDFFIFMKVNIIEKNYR